MVTVILLIIIGILVLFVIVLWVGQNNFLKEISELKATIRKMTTLAGITASQMVKDYLRRQGYTSLVCKAASEFVKSGSLEGPACSAWLQTLAFIGMDSAWWEAAGGVLHEAHQVAEESFERAGLQIVLSRLGECRMEMPPYTFSLADEDGRLGAEQQVATKDQFLAVLGQHPEALAVSVLTPGGEQLLGTPGVIKVVLS